MLISKYKGKNGKVYINFVVKKDLVNDTKNKDYVRLSLDQDWTVGLDDKKSCKLKQIINTKKLVLNNK